MLNRLGALLLALVKDLGDIGQYLTNPGLEGKIGRYLLDHFECNDSRLGVEARSVELPNPVDYHEG